MNNLITIGRYVFGIAVAGFGVQQIIFHTFLPVFIPSWPAGVPAHLFLAYFFGIFLIVAGLAMALNIKRRVFAFAFGLFCLVLLLFVHLPFLIKHPPDTLLSWADAFTMLALAGGAFIVANSQSGSAKWILTGRICFAILLITFGMEHFVYSRFVMMLVPSWIPGHLFWTYLCGAALVAAGISILSGIMMRRGALLLGIMLLLWVILLHLPRAFADPRSNLGAEWMSVFEALAFGGVAFVIAGRRENAS